MVGVFYARLCIVVMFINNSVRFGYRICEISVVLLENTNVSAFKIVQEFSKLQ